MHAVLLLHLHAQFSGDGKCVYEVILSTLLHSHEIKETAKNTCVLRVSDQTNVPTTRDILLYFYALFFTGWTLPVCYTHLLANSIFLTAKYLHDVHSAASVSVFL